MPILILGAIVITLFVIGVSLLLKGYMNTPNPATVVPLEKLIQTQNDLHASQAETVKLKLQMDTLALKIDEMKTQLTEAKKREEIITAMRIKENENLEKIHALEMDLNFLSQKADQQAQEAIEVINLLRAESEQFKKELAQRSAVDPAEIEKLNNEIQTLHTQLQERDVSIKKIEDEAVKKIEVTFSAQIQQLTDELTKAQAQINQLNTANQKLTAELEPLRQELTTMQETAAKLKDSQAPAVPTEAAGAESKAAASAEIQKLTDELTKAQSDSRKQIEEAQAQIKQLTADLAASREAFTQAKQKQEAAIVSVPPVEAATNWIKEKEQLESQLKKLQDINKHLIEKEKILQLELTKSRMRVIGLERIWEDFKSQSPKP